MADKGSALYLCPGCGAFVSESASKCPKCGEVLDAPSDEDVLDEMDTALSEIEAVEELALLDEEIAASEESEPVTLYLCSACGAFTGGDSLTCLNCGASMQPEEEQKPLIKPEDPESEILDMLVEADEPPVNENIIEDLKKLESAEDVESFLQAITDEDDGIGISLTPPPELAPERSDESDDILSKLVPETSETGDGKPGERSGAIDSVREMLADGSALRAAGDNDTIALCGNCGAFVSESATVCNICGHSLADGRHTATGPSLDMPETADEDANAVMRSVLGVSEDAVLDGSAGDRFQSDGSLGLCTVCGAFISQEAKSCPVCGTHMEDMPEFVPSLDILEPEQEDHGLAICPYCGVFVPEGAKECLSCVKPIPDGAAVPISREVERPEDPDRAANTLKTFLGVEKALEFAPVRDRSFQGLDLCPECGAFVSMDAVVCSVCGNSLFEEGTEEIPKDGGMSLPDMMKCPHCGSSVSVHSEECMVCGMSFSAQPEPASASQQSDDITDFLDIELESTIRKLESETSVQAPDSADATEPLSEGTEISDLIVLEQEEMQPDQPLEPEALEFLGPEEEVPEDIPVPEEAEDILMEDAVVPAAKPSKLPEIIPGANTSVNAANWTTVVYVSVAAICFFLFFYAIAPGSYAPGLAVIFGALMILGIYLAMTEKYLFSRSDLRNSAIFIIGALFAIAVLVRWPLGLFTSEAGLNGQPVIDRILLSSSILLTSIGMLWVRARIRFIITWFFGNILLFLSAMISFVFSNYGTGLESPVLIVAGFGAGLVFLSLALLQHERAINTSIETEVIRGDTRYLERDFSGAMASYDAALSKSGAKKAEARGSPIVQYDIPWYSKGSALILMGKYEDGIRCLDMALAINPNNEVTWVNKGNAHSKLGQLDVALECYMKAVECNPFYEIALNNMGNVYARRKEYLEALKQYNRALKINRRYDDAWINKGYVLAKMGKKEQAIECLNHVGSRAKGTPVPVDKDVHLL